MPTNHTVAQTTTITREDPPIGQLRVRLPGENAPRTVQIYPGLPVDAPGQLYCRCLGCNTFQCRHTEAAEKWWHANG